MLLGDVVREEFNLFRHHPTFVVALALGRVRPSCFRGLQPAAQSLTPPPAVSLAGTFEMQGGIIMMKHAGTIAGLVAALALAAGCGSSSTGSTAAGGGNTTVDSAHSATLNANVLVDNAGMTLYTLSAE